MQQLELKILETDDVGKLLKESHRLLRRAWDHPLELGMESKICQSVTRHYEKLLSYATPADPSDADLYREALFASWWAVWRSRDYSLLGWQKRYKLDQVPRSLVRGAIDCEGVRWPAFHVPLFDRELNPITKAKSGQSFRPHQEPKRIFEDANFEALSEGMIYSWPPEQDRHTYAAKWSFITDAKFTIASTSECMIGFEDVSRNLELPAPKNTELNLTWDNCHRTVFFIRVDRRRPLETLSSNRFEAGLKVQDTHLNLVEFPRDVETGDTLEFLQPKQVELIRISGWPGLKNLRIESFNHGRLELDGVQGVPVYISGTANRLPDAGKTAEIQLQDCSLPACLIESLHVDDLSIVDCQFESILLVSNSPRIANLLIENSSQTLSSNRTVGSLGERRLRNWRPSGSSLSHEFGVMIHQINVGEVSFHNVEIAGDFFCVDAQINDWMEFSGITIGGHTDFYLSTWNQFLIGSPEQKRSQGAEFLGPVDFSQPMNADSAREVGELLIYDSKFERDSSFENLSFKRSTAFERCEFMECPRFQSSQLNLDTSFRRTEFLWLVRMQDVPIEKRDSWLSRTEGSFRTLAKQMDEIKAHGWKSKFHSFQLQARFMREEDEDVPYWDRVFARGYGALSDFGGSFVMPASIWLAHIWIFWYVYWSFILVGSYVEGISNPYSGPTTVLMMVLSLALRPFYALSPAFGRPTDSECGPHGTCETAYELMSYMAREHEILFKSLGIAQTLVSTTLIFLFLLAVRRKFQLS